MHLPGQFLGFRLCDFGLAGLERGLSLGLDPLNLLGFLRFFLGQSATGDAADVGLHGIRQDELAPADGGKHAILCQLLHSAACDSQYQSQFGGGHVSVSKSFFCRHPETTSFSGKTIWKIP